MKKSFWSNTALVAVSVLAAFLVLSVLIAVAVALFVGPGDAAARRSAIPDSRPSAQWTEIAAPLDANRSILTACDPTNDGFRIYVAAGRSSGSTTSNQDVSVVADASCKK